MKTIFSFLTMIGLLTLCLAGSLSAERLLYEHTVNRDNKNVEITRPDPVWQGDGNDETRDGDINVSAEKRIFDVSESQAKSTVSSSVEILCNVHNGGFVGVAQIKGTADTGLSAYLAKSYEGITDSGIPETLETSHLNTYQGKSGNKDKTSYVVRLPGVNSDLLYTGIKRHGVTLKKGLTVLGVELRKEERRDLNFGESASTVKQKRVGATDADIIAMFSPYAFAMGSAQNNAGEGIGNQVPAESAHTGMEGETITNITDPGGGSSGGSPIVSPTPPPPTPTPSASLSASSSSVSPGDSVTFELATVQAFSSVYWYVAVPGESGLGSNIEMDTGSSSSTTESFTYTFPSSAASGDWKITAYIYDYLDNSTYEMSSTVSVSGSSDTPPSSGGTTPPDPPAPNPPTPPSTLVQCLLCGTSYDPNSDILRHTETLTCDRPGCGLTYTACTDWEGACLHSGSSRHSAAVK